MKGRKPTPTVLRKLHGNPSRTPFTVNEPVAPGDLIESPAWLTESQREAWNFAIANAPANLLRRLDKALLTLWVLAEDTHRLAAMHLNRGNGQLLTYANPPPRDENGKVINPEAHQLAPSPYLSIMNKQAIIMIKVAAEMGFTPAGRARAYANTHLGPTLPGKSEPAESMPVLDYIAAKPSPPRLN